MADIGLDRTAAASHAPASPKAAALGVLALAGLVAAALLSLPLKLAIGTYYWDIYFFVDASSRIRDGQIPHVDFFLSVGALPYYLYDLAARIWPDGQPLLLGQYSLLFVTMPLMAAVALASDASRGTLLALVLPFAFFSLAPVNTGQISPVPGVDGYGLYNREAGLVLFVLASALVAVKRQAALGVIAGLALGALFFVKITGFVAGAGFVGVAFLAGRFSFRAVLPAAVAFLVPVAAVELFLGFVSVYLSDIAAMLAQNSGGFAQRLMQLAAAQFDVLAALALLMVPLLAVDARKVALAPPGFLSKAAGVMALPSAQLPLLVGFSVIFEMQNTGSQEFIYLWPFLIGVFARGYRRLPGRIGVVLVALVVLAALPTFTKTAHRAVWAAAIMPAQVSLDLPELGVLDSVGARADYVVRARRMREHYARLTDEYRALAADGQPPAFLYYIHPDQQVLFLIDIAEAMRAIEKREVESGIRYESLAALDFVDPLPMLMGRGRARGMPMGLDPFRGYPAARHDDFRAGLAEVDAILQPLCPWLEQRFEITAIARPVLEGRVAVQIDPCWIAWEKPGLSG